MRHYRRDIDGLRALAVMPVVLFHAGVRMFSGGFVGVDIFFVISGYLITQAILKPAAEGRFCLLRFYEMRVRRILPALAVMLLPTVVLAYVLYLPYDLFSFSKSLVATTVFASNIEFLREQNYFSTVNSVKPLLHTWSLALEEQFYLVFPLCLMLLLRGTRLRWMTVIAVGAMATSFLWSAHHVIDAPAQIFYLLLPRAWELLLGTMLALRLLPRPNGVMAEGLSLIGLGFILYSICSFSDRTIFPGPMAIIPCLGAALSLYANRENTFGGRLLSSAPFVAIGLISYSVYLWHWPIIVFSQYVLMRPLTGAEVAVVVCLALTIGFFSWRFVEQPFRKSEGVFTRRPLFVVAAITLISYAIVGFAGYRLNGVPRRFNGEIAYLAAYAWYPYGHYYNDGTCFVGNFAQPYAQFPQATCMERKDGIKNVLLWGDSHAAHYYYGLEKIATGIHVMQATHGGCPSIEDISGLAPKVCNEFYRHILDSALVSPPDTVILSNDWQSYPDPGFSSLKNTVATLRQRGIPVILIGPNFSYRDSLPSLLARNEIFHKGVPFQTSRFLADHIFTKDAEMQRIFSQMNGVAYISPLQTLCNKRVCPVFSGESPLLWDAQHLTAAGSIFVVEKSIWPRLSEWLLSTHAHPDKRGMRMTGQSRTQPRFS